jgi:hypothetical protein
MRQYFVDAVSMTPIIFVENTLVKAWRMAFRDLFLHNS